MKKLWMIFLVVVSLTSIFGYTQTPIHQYGDFQYKEINDYSPFGSAPYGTPYMDSVLFLEWDASQAWRKDKVGGIGDGPL